MEAGDDELIVKRSFSIQRTNRQFINGSPTTLGVLKNLGDELVDLHGPHDHQSLLSPDRQLGLLDALRARGRGAVRSSSRASESCKRLRAEHAALNTAEAAREQEIDLLRHQVSEITSANLIRRRGRRNRRALQTRGQQQTPARAGWIDHAASFRSGRLDPPATGGNAASPARAGKNRSGESGVGRSARGQRSLSFPRSRDRSANMPKSSISIRPSSPRSRSESRFSKR